MTRIEWDLHGDRNYVRGISNGVLYPENPPGVAWNGLISVSESGDKNQESYYFNGRKYNSRNLRSCFSGSISAFTYPDELDFYIGKPGIFSAQGRFPFGFSYRTSRSIHIVYNVFLSSSDISYVSLGENPEVQDFEWQFTTLPEKFPGGEPTSHIVIMTDEVKTGVLADLEAVIYGDDENDPRLPSFQEIVSIFESGATLRVRDNGDGTWTALGPDEVITMIGDDMFQISWPSVTIIDDTTFTIISL